MRKLIWYIRTAFCNHEWEYEEAPYRLYADEVSSDTILKESTKVSATCKKCGWHRKYFKF